MITRRNVAAFAILSVIGASCPCEAAFSHIAASRQAALQALRVSSVSSPQQTTSSLLEQDETYSKNFDLIDECAASGQPSEGLYDAVRYIDRNALKLYPDQAAKDELWDRAHGSWKLQLATGGGKFTAFKPVPIFAYAMIDDKCFGNGVGINESSIIIITRTDLNLHLSNTNNLKIPPNLPLQ